MGWGILSEVFFEHKSAFLIFVPLMIIVAIYRGFFFPSPRYLFPLSKIIKTQKLASKSFHKKVFWTLRGLTLLLSIILIAGPQKIDFESKTHVEGIDIVIALDASESMHLLDDLKDPRERIEVAKTEALKFIQKRTSDPIGIVIFGQDSVSKCPLTLDKEILRKIVEGIHIGEINPYATSLATGLATAANRLKTSKSKNKVIILLTDGKPNSRGEKISIGDAVKIAKYQLPQRGPPLFLCHARLDELRRHLQ